MLGVKGKPLSIKSCIKKLSSNTRYTGFVFVISDHGALTTAAGIVILCSWLIKGMSTAYCNSKYLIIITILIRIFFN